MFTINGQVNFKKVMIDSETLEKYYNDWNRYRLENHIDYRKYNNESVKEFKYFLDRLWNRYREAEKSFIVQSDFFF